MNSLLKDYLAGRVPLEEIQEDRTGLQEYGLSLPSEPGPAPHGAFRKFQLDNAWREFKIKVETLWADVLDTDPEIYDSALHELETVRRTNPDNCHSILQTMDSLDKLLWKAYKSPDLDHEKKAFLKVAVARNTLLLRELEYMCDELSPLQQTTPGVPALGREEYEKKRADSGDARLGDRDEERPTDLESPSDKKDAVRKGQDDRNLRQDRMDAKKSAKEKGRDLKDIETSNRREKVPDEESEEQAPEQPKGEPRQPAKKAQASSGDEEQQDDRPAPEKPKDERDDTEPRGGEDSDEDGKDTDGSKKPAIPAGDLKKKRHEKEDEKLKETVEALPEVATDITGADAERDAQALLRTLAVANNMREVAFDLKAFAKLAPAYRKKVVRRFNDIARGITQDFWNKIKTNTLIVVKRFAPELIESASVEVSDLLETTLIEHEKCADLREVADVLSFCMSEHTDVDHVSCAITEEGAIDLFMEWALPETKIRMAGGGFSQGAKHAGPLSRKMARGAKGTASLGEDDGSGRIDAIKTAAQRNQGKSRKQGSGLRVTFSGPTLVQNSARFRAALEDLGIPYRQPTPKRGSLIYVFPDDLDERGLPRGEYWRIRNEKGKAAADAATPSGGGGKPAASPKRKKSKKGAAKKSGSKKKAKGKKDKSDDGDKKRPRKTIDFNPLKHAQSNLGLKEREE